MSDLPTLLNRRISLYTGFIYISELRRGNVMQDSVVGDIVSWLYLVDLKCYHDNPHRFNTLESEASHRQITSYLLRSNQDKLN